MQKVAIKKLIFFAINQANGQIVRTIINHPGLSKDKAAAETFSKYGNCGGTSVLVNYCDQMFGKVSNSTLFVSFGVGLSVASCKLDLSDTINGGVTLYKTPDCIQSRDQLISE